jgi:hypothetical protein
VLRFIKIPVHGPGRAPRKIKGVPFVEPLLVNLLRLGCAYCAAVESAAAVVSAAVVSTAAGASVATLSVVSVVSVLPPPQATNARANPHTIKDAISFFIVFTGFKIACKYTYIGIIRAPYVRKILVCRPTGCSLQLFFSEKQADGHPFEVELFAKPVLQKSLIRFYNILGQVAEESKRWRFGRHLCDVFDLDMFPFNSGWGVVRNFG